MHKEKRMDETKTMNRGFDGSLDDVKRIWRTNARTWSHRVPPWRPSPGDMTCYRELAGSLDAKNILIIGSTPELRDIAARGRVTIIDICPEMVASTKKFLAVANPSHENVKISDWCDMPFKDSQFDVILGDFFWWLLSTTRQKIMGEQIARVLKHDGVLVTRVHFYEPSLLKESPGSIVRKYIAHLRDTDDSQGVAEQLAARLLDSTTDTDLERTDIARALGPLTEELGEYEEASVEKTFLRKFIKNFMKRTNWTSQARDRVVSSMVGDLVLLGEKTADDYEHSELYPVLKFGKKFRGVGL